MKRKNILKRIFSLALGLTVVCSTIVIPQKVKAEEVTLDDILSFSDDIFLERGDTINFGTNNVYYNICIMDASGAVIDTYPQASSPAGGTLFWGDGHNINSYVGSGFDADEFSNLSADNCLSGQSSLGQDYLKRLCKYGKSYTFNSGDADKIYVVDAEKIDGHDASVAFKAYGTPFSVFNPFDIGMPEDSGWNYESIVNVTISEVSGIRKVFVDTSEGGGDIETLYVRDANDFNDYINAVGSDYSSNDYGWIVEGVRYDLHFLSWTDIQSLPITGTPTVRLIYKDPPIREFSIPDIPYGSKITYKLVVDEPYVASNVVLVYTQKKEGASYSSTPPTEIGTYEAVVAVGTHDSPAVFDSPDCPMASCSFKIVKANGSGKVTMNNFVFGGTPSTPKAESSTNAASAATFTYKLKSAPDTSYTSAVPTAVGDYTVRASFPSNNHYNGCSATADFKISYLPYDKSMITLVGNPNSDGWYSDKVVIKPTGNYQISLNTRTNFNKDGIELSDATPNAFFFIRNSVTGEQTDMIKMTDCKIDMTAPSFIGLKEDERCYGDKTGKCAIEVKEKNVKNIYVDDKMITSYNTVGDNIVFTFDILKKPTEFTIRVVDMAGNEATKTIEVAPAWMESGIVEEGDWYLEEEEYTLPGGSWDVGDGMTYMGGNNFWAAEGDYTFKKD